MMRLRQDYDVVVAGGGTAGAMAGIAAARAGAKTLVVDQYGNLGGALALGMALLGASDAEGARALGGIGGELLSRLEDMAAATKISGHPLHGSIAGQDPEATKMVVLAMAREAGVHFLLHTFIAEVLLEESRVQGLVAANKGGLEIIPGQVFVDATGDADLVARAGGQVVLGRPEDGKTQPASKIFRVGGVDLNALWDYLEAHPEEVKVPPGWSGAAHTPHDLRSIPGTTIDGFWHLIAQARKAGDYHLPQDMMGIYTLPNRSEVTINVTRVHDIDGTNADDITRAEIETQLQMLEVLQFLRQYVPGFSASYIMSTPFQVGIRETRHIQGHYTLTRDDVLSGRSFEDQVGRGAYPLDIHDVGDGGKILNRDVTGRGSVLWKIPQSYGIPRGALVPRGVDNIVVGGRAISATHEAAGSVRGQAVCMVTGHAAGVMAALSAQQHVSPAELKIAEIQARLREQGAILERARVPRPVLDKGGHQT